MTGVSTLRTVKHVLKINGGVVQTLRGGVQGPPGPTGDQGIQGVPGPDAAVATHAAASKATPVDADELPLVDSAAAFALKRLTWVNLKTTLQTFFDALYLKTIAPLVIASANVIEQRNGANAQTFRLANTYTDAGNNEFGFAGWIGNEFVIKTTAAGLSSARQLVFDTPTGATGIDFRTGGVSRFFVWSNAVEVGLTLRPYTNNAIDIGIGGGSREFRHFYQAGFHDLTAMTPPPAPGANRVRLYAAVTGGKVALMAIFPTGAAQVVISEP